jgi:hypothetical protein
MKFAEVNKETSFLQGLEPDRECTITQGLKAPAS